LGLARPILADISWRVEAGEHWALVGENGSGKSTLLSIVSGELWPSRGVARVLGEEYGRWVGSSGSGAFGKASCSIAKSSRSR
jgi:ABC-type molybdenum transport system ATPase subunit/photorepair protein PhrA